MNHTDPPSPTRRAFLQTIAGTGVVAIAGAAEGAIPSSTMAATSPSSSPSSAPTTAAAAIPVEDIAATCRVLGHDFRDDEIAMMADAVTSNREKLKRWRSRTIDPRTEPAVHFDARIAGAAPLPRGEDAFSLSDAPIPDYDGRIESLAFRSAADLSRLLRARKITSVELTKMYLARLDTIGRRLHAVVTLTADLALAQAARADAELAAGKIRGPLHGLPWGAKDLLATKGIPTTWGVKPFANRVLDYDATVVEKLEAAGAVLCAKLSLGELAMGDTWFGGQTKTPWNESEGSSGSSAGPAAAVAAGCVAFAIGSETMGSIVSPCLVNGVVGLRPTYGRVSRAGAMPLARSMDKLGPMCRSVEDCAMVLSAIHGADPLDATAVADVPFRWDPSASLDDLRIGVDADVFDAIRNAKPSAKRDAQLAALAKIESLAGRPLIPVKLPDPKPYSGIAGTVIAVESASSFAELVESGQVRELVQQEKGSWPNEFRFGSLIPASDYLRAMQIRAELQAAYRDAMRDVDVYVTIPYSGSTLYMTNSTGHPTVVSRCGIVDGRPIMIEFLGQPFREDASLRVAHAYERATHWGDRWPAI